MTNTMIYSRDPQAIVAMIPRYGTEPEQHDKHVRHWRWQAFEQARLEHEIKFGLAGYRDAQ